MGNKGSRDSGCVGRATLKWVSNDCEGADGDKREKIKEFVSCNNIRHKEERLTASQTD